LKSNSAELINEVEPKNKILKFTTLRSSSLKS